MFLVLEFKCLQAHASIKINFLNQFLFLFRTKLVFLGLQMEADSNWSESQIVTTHNPTAYLYPKTAEVMDL